MNREFLDFYNRELKVLREQAAEFAQEYPGVAERLGGLLADRTDPMISGLLEGSAFLAARVQLKIKHEFADFTTNLIDQLTPQYLAPTPSFLLTEIIPKFGDPALREGRTIPRGAYFEATYREMERNVACRFRLAAPVTLWPFDLVKAEYLTSPAPLQMLLPSSGVEAAAGLRLQFTVRAAARREDEPTEEEATKRSEFWASRCKTKSMRFHLLGPEADAVALYEQLFAHCRHVYFRRLDAFGDPVGFRAEPDMLQQIGFGEQETLIPNDLRLFRGFDFLREYLAFPRKFLGFDLVGLEKVMPRLDAKTFDVIFTFDEVNPRLAAAVRPQAFSTYAAPAANLFEKTLDRVPVTSNQYEYPVLADRSHPLDYEVNRIISVSAHIPGLPERTPVAPLYSAAAGYSRTGLCYTVRRLPRRRTVARIQVRPRVRLHRHRDFLVAGRSPRPRRHATGFRTQRAGALHQQTPRRSFAARRWRRRFPVARRRHPDIALCRWADTTARAADDRDGRQDRDRYHRRDRLAAHQYAEPQPSRAG